MTYALYQQQKQAEQNGDTEAIEAIRTLAGGILFRIPSENMNSLNEKLTKLNRRAARLGTAPITADAVSSEIVEEKVPARALRDDFGNIIEVLEWRTVAHEWTYVVLNGETPMLNGWQFAATLLHDEAGTIIRRMPSFGAEVDLTQYRDADPSNCEHCKADRRRRDTYVVYKAETGETMQVGSSCLKDFLGYNNPEAVARFLENVRDFFVSLSDEESESTGMREPTLYGTVDYLAHVACMIRNYGWISRKQAEADFNAVATSIAAYYNMMNYGDTNKFGNKMYDDLEPEDAEIAKAAFDFSQSHFDIDGNEFEHNMAVAFANLYFNARNKGFVAYGVQAYLKDRTEKIEAEIRKQNPSEFQGEVGKRQIFNNLTVSSERTIEGQYGEFTSHLYTILDSDGNVFKWFASNPILEVGQTYDLKATVKKHEEYKGQKQTLINRAVIV